MQHVQPVTRGRWHDARRAESARTAAQFQQEQEAIAERQRLDREERAAREAREREERAVREAREAAVRRALRDAELAAQAAAAARQAELQQQAEQQRQQHHEAHVRRLVQEFNDAATLRRPCCNQVLKWSDVEPRLDGGLWDGCAIVQCNKPGCQYGFFCICYLGFACRHLHDGIEHALKKWENCSGRTHPTLTLVRENIRTKVRARLKETADGAMHRGYANSELRDAGVATSDRLRREQGLYLDDIFPGSGKDVQGAMRRMLGN